MRSGDEDEVQSALEIVGLQRASNGGGDLERCLAERERSEGDRSGRDETDSLEVVSDELMQTACAAYSKRRKDFGLANERRSALFGVALNFLALGDWASCRSVVHFRACHDQQFSALRLCGGVPCNAMARTGGQKKFAEMRLD